MQVGIYCQGRLAGCWRASTHEPVGPGTQHFQRSLGTFLLRVLATAFRVGPIKIVGTTFHTPGKLLGTVDLILKLTDTRPYRPGSAGQALTLPRSARSVCEIGCDPHRLGNDRISIFFKGLKFWALSHVRKLLQASTDGMAVAQIPFINSDRLIPRVLAMTSILRRARFRSPLSIPPM